MKMTKNGQKALLEVLEKFFSYSFPFPGSLDFVVPSRDFKIQDIDLLDSLRRMSTLRQLLQHSECTMVPDFKNQFARVQARRALEDRMERLKYLMSEESLSMLPDYKMRIEVSKSKSRFGGQKDVKFSS